jgi:hypothetical protein
MWVVVWDENNVVGPFKDKTQARDHINACMDHPLTRDVADDFIVQVRRPRDPDYNHSLVLISEMIYDGE